MTTRINSKQRRKFRTRAMISNSDRPRLSVFRSNKLIYAQVIDDTKGITLASAKASKDTAGAIKVGESIANQALKKGVKSVVFDRGQYKYHGKIKAIAESARKGGLEF
jgi:large subunit ribosomal protein L18